ncbi:MAG TPA: histidine phosphotransferase family protein [Caulobacteraceae bacterium]
MQPHDPDAVLPVDLAARLAARLCHDFISPVSAIVSGLDLIDDPEQQDMREEAMSLIATSARKLAALLSFARIAFGGSTASELFDVRELERLSREFFEHARSQLDWAIEPAGLSKPAARALLNLVQLGATALPVGGTARLSARDAGDEVHLALDAEGARARLRPEAIDGLEGRSFAEGLGGQWVQTYFLRSVVDQAAGTLTYEVAEDAVRVRVTLPRE